MTVRRYLWTASLIAVTLGGCTRSTPHTATPPTLGEFAVSAVLTDPGGVTHGTATVTTAHGVSRLDVEATGMPPGPHGLHIHSVGRCDAPDFASAGPHWNPDGKMHGRDNPMGMHRGDLPNLMIGTDGRGRVGIDLVAGARAMMDADGASIVVHATADDLKTDPSGNSGARIACGVFAPGRPPVG